MRTAFNLIRYIAKKLIQIQFHMMVYEERFLEYHVDVFNFNCGRNSEDQWDNQWLDHLGTVRSSANSAYIEGIPIFN